MMSRVAVVLMLMVACVGLAWGQQGTANLPSAVPWQSDDVQLSTEARLFSDTDNTTFDFNLRSRLDTNSEVQVGWFYMSTSGPDPIADTIRASELQLMPVHVLYQVADGTVRAAIRGGVELPTGTPVGINTDTRAFAAESRPIPTLSVPVEWGDPNNWLVIVEPKGVGFDADMMASDGSGVVEGFGNLFILGAGVRHNAGSLSLFADAAYPLSGDNTINEDTNAVEQGLAWSAGGTYVFGGSHDLTVDLFATTSAGPTPATSTIVAPDDCVGVGLRVGGRW